MRRRKPLQPDTDVVELLGGVGVILMAIDAKLAQVIHLLEREDEDGEVDT